MADATAPTRRGRPRRSGREGDGDVAEQILAAAKRLIAERGIDGTSLSRVAREVGLTQSALYYYFANKNELVAALLASPQFMPTTSLREIVAEGSTPAVQLFRFVRQDVVNLCSAPLDLSGIARISEQDRDAFADYWQAVRDLEADLAAVLRAGIEQGELRPVEPELTAVTVLTNDEGAQGRYLGAPHWPVDAVANSVAELTVSGLLAPGAGPIGHVRAEADRLDEQAAASA